MPTVNELVEIRPEVREGGLQGIIALAQLISDEADAFEKDAARVLEATFPSETIKRLLQRLKASIADDGGDKKGNFFISGGYGTGKSHLLLTLYHLLQSPEVAAEWLQAHQIDFTPPADAVVALMPMIQLTRADGSGLKYVWEHIFEVLGYDGFEHTGSNVPTARHLKEAVAGRRVFLIIDEIERWFMPIADQAQAQANITFLQVLSEFCQDADNGIILFLTLLRIAPQVTDILARVDAHRDDMTQAPDRKRVVLHRLVKEVDREAAGAVVDAYIEAYRKIEAHISIADYGKYREEMLTCYPFHPDAIQTVFDRYSSVASLQDESYQNSRGALYLLADVLNEVVMTDAGGRSILDETDLICLGDISLTSDHICDNLRELSTGLVDVSVTNLRSSDQIERAAPVLSTILMYSLGRDLGDETDKKQTKRPRLGAQLGDIYIATLTPPSSPGGGCTPDQVNATLAKLEDTAVNLHREENPARWLFREDVNIQAQINRRARTDAVGSRAPAAIVDAIHELVPGSTAVYPHEQIPDQAEITIVVSLRQLEAEVITESIYPGRSYSNALVIITPESHLPVNEDPDLLWLARTMLAADDLMKETVGLPDMTRQLRAKRDESQRQLLSTLPNRYGRWQAPVPDPATGELGFRAINVPLRKDAILTEVSNRYDSHFIETTVMGVVRSKSSAGPPTVGEIYAEFYRQRAYPKPVYEGRASTRGIERAICTLVRQWRLRIIRGGDEHTIQGQDPGTLDRDWHVAESEGPPPIDLAGVILTYLKQRGEKGAPVAQVRDRCRQEVVDVPDMDIEDLTIDEVITELVATHQLETPSLRELPASPLGADLLLRAPRHEGAGGNGPEPMSFDRLTPGAAKTKIVQVINKTDRLSEVEIGLVQKLRGKQAAAGTGRQLRLKDELLDEEAQVEVVWRLTGMNLTTRDALVDTLDTLPTDGDALVQVSLKRLSPRNGGDA